MTKFILSLLVVFSLAKASADPIGLAHSEQKRNDQRACAYSAFLLSYVDATDEAELKSVFEEQYEEYRHWLRLQNAHTYTKQERKLQQKILGDLEVLAHSNERRSILSKTFEALCTVGRTGAGAVVKGVALTGSVATTVMTVSLRLGVKFGTGIATRRPQKERGPGYLEFMGGKAGAGNWISVLYQGVRTLFYGANPLLLGVYGVTAIDMQTQGFCRSERPKTPRQQEFCRQYEKLKKGEYEIVNSGRTFGVSVGKQLLHTFDFRSDQYLDTKICHEKIRKQYRVASRARERLTEKLKAIGVLKPAILVVPPNIDGCVTLQINELEKQEYARVSDLGSHIIDGILYTFELKKEDTVPSDDGSAAASATPVSSPVPSPTPDFSTDEGICKAAYGYKLYTEATRKPEIAKRLDVLQMVVSPGRYSKPASQEIIMDEEFMVQQPVATYATGRNIILVIAPTDEQRKEYETIRPTLEGMQAERKAEYQKLKYLAKAKDYYGCLERQKATHFNYKAYVELGEKINKIQVGQRIQEYDAMIKQTNKAGAAFLNYGNKLKLNWEVIPMKSLNDVRSILRDPKVQNLILVSHGEENGKIVDARLNELPSVAFESITPNLQSVFFFSCHSESALKSYNLVKLGYEFLEYGAIPDFEEMSSNLSKISLDLKLGMKLDMVTLTGHHLASQPSFHQLRFAGNVKSASFLEEANQAPVIALANYIEKVDAKLYQAGLGNTRVQMVHGSRFKKSNPGSECSLSFEGLTIINGAFNVKINRKWAGTYYQGATGGSLKFPCNWVREGPIVVNLENPNLIEKSSIAHKEVNLRIYTPLGLKTDLPSNAKVRTEDGTFANMRWDIAQ